MSRFILVATILLAILCNFTMVNADNPKPVASAVFFGPNTPFDGSYTGKEVIYIRISTQRSGVSYPLIVYTGSIQVALTLPPAVNGSPSTSSEHEPSCALLANNTPVGSTEYVFTQKTGNVNAKLILTTSLPSNFKTDHLRYFCYNLPNPSSNFDSFESPNTVLTYIPQGGSETSLNLDTAFREVVDEPYENDVLVTYTVDTPLLSPEIVDDVMTRASSTLTPIGLGISAYSVRPNKDLSSSTLTFSMSVLVDHDLVYRMLIEEQILDSFKTVLTPSGHDIIGEFEFRLLNTPLHCSEENSCGNTGCPLCPEESACESNEECVYNSCINKICHFNGVASIATVLSMSLMMAASFAVLF